MSARARQRPVQLQANTHGAWKSVLRFDAGDATAAAAVQEAAARLYEVDPNTSWRIVTDGRHPMVLRHLSFSGGGRWLDRS